MSYIFSRQNLICFLKVSLTLYTPFPPLLCMYVCMCGVLFPIILFLAYTLSQVSILVLVPAGYFVL